MTARQKFTGEVMLLGWADTSARGKTVTFQIHPDEAPGEHPFKNYGTGKTGQRFALVAVPIDDDGKAVGQGAPDAPPTPQPPPGDGPIAGGNTEKKRRPFHERPLSQQCAIRCASAEFHSWLGRQFLMPEFGTGGATVEAAKYVRERLKLTSRSELDTNPVAAARWRAMETQYLRDTGQLAEARG